MTIKFSSYSTATQLHYQSISIYHSSTQFAAPHVHFLVELQCSSQCRDGNMSTAAHHNGNVVEYEPSFKAFHLLIEHVANEQSLVNPLKVIPRSITSAMYITL